MDFRGIWVAKGTESLCPKVQRPSCTSVSTFGSSAPCRVCPVPGRGSGGAPRALGQMCHVTCEAHGMHSHTSHVWLPWGDAGETITDLSALPMQKLQSQKVICLIYKTNFISNHLCLRRARRNNIYSFGFDVGRPLIPLGYLMAGTQTKKERRPVVYSVGFVSFFSVLDRMFSLEALLFLYWIMA